jgi:hypothetical protein
MNDVNFRNKENDISFWNKLFQKNKILQKCHSTCTNVILFDSDIYTTKIVYNTCTLNVFSPLYCTLYN